MTTESDQVIERWLPQFRKGLLEFIILLKLQQGQSYGYEIASEIKKADDDRRCRRYFIPIVKPT